MIEDEVFDLSAPEFGVYTTAEAAALLKVSARTIQMEVQRGRLKARKVGRAIRITHTALLRYLEGEAS